MAKNKPAASSRPEKLIRRSESDIRAYIKSPKCRADAERSRARGPDPTTEDLKEIPVLTEEELRRM